MPHFWNAQVTCMLCEKSDRPNGWVDDDYGRLWGVSFARLVKDRECECGFPGTISLLSISRNRYEPNRWDVPADEDFECEDEYRLYWYGDSVTLYKRYVDALHRLRRLLWLKRRRERFGAMSHRVRRSDYPWPVLLWLKRRRERFGLWSNVPPSATLSLSMASLPSRHRAPAICAGA